MLLSCTFRLYCGVFKFLTLNAVVKRERGKEAGHSESEGKWCTVAWRQLDPKYTDWFTTHLMPQGAVHRSGYGFKT